VWFNHAFFFNARALEPVEVREALHTLRRQHPHWCGNHRRAARLLRGCVHSMAPRREDALIVDNMLTSHARAPFRGACNIVGRGD
jgi:hypothetical protein